MRILLSNDDGIFSPGMEILASALRGLGDLTIVAPDAERSAVGHAITLSDPIKTRELFRNGELFGYAASGTPADCVKLAVCALMDQPPDLVVSGINLGPNAGISIIYSGTVSAATEGTILGIPSMAVSLATFVHPQWETAGRATRILAEFLIAQPLPVGVLLNVNIPNRVWGDIRGFRSTRMGASRFIETFDRRKDPRGNDYYWMDGFIEAIPPYDETDLSALDAGFISLTPISFDLTNTAAFEQLRSRIPQWISD